MWKGRREPSLAGSQHDETPRLTPEMSSFRLLVLGFVRDYWTEHGGSPSYGEIASGLDTYKGRVKWAVRSLVADGELLRTPGPRGLRLPSERDKAIQLLQDLGISIEPVTNPTLPVPPELDYPRDAESGDQDDEKNP